jgi:homoserine kinase type II
MAVYTSISDEDVAALLAGYDLGSALALKGIAEGVSNSNFILETDSGRFILTLFEKRTRIEDLPFFLGLMHWLADHDFPSAAPIANLSGQLLSEICGKPAVIVSFLSGLSVARPSVDHCREAGIGLARLHVAAQGFDLTRRNDLGQKAWSAMFAPLGEAADLLKPGLSQRIADDLIELERDWPVGLPSGPIHADFFPDNVFFTGQRFSGAIDFYFACHDLLAYDVAIALNAWCFEPDGSLNHTKAQALLAGYRSVRQLSPSELGALPVLARGAAMRFFLTRLRDWGATPAGSLVKPHDPLVYERRLAVHRASQDMDLLGIL